MDYESLDRQKKRENQKRYDQELASQIQFKNSNYQRFGGTNRSASLNYQEMQSQ
jgi:hypothetical protein